MKGLKLKAADNLASIRKQIVDLIEPNATVLEFGCGNGDLLLKLSSQIKSGLGIDKSKALIDQAVAEKKKRNITNVEFFCEELGRNYKYSETYDFSVASLFLHVIPVCESVYLINKMKELSTTMLICSFSRPETAYQKFVLWLDQRFSGHYRNFKAYQKLGYLEGLLEKTQYSNMITYHTFIPTVKIYKIN